MTETTAYGAASQPQPAFINGSMPLDHGLQRKPMRKDPGLRHLLPAAATADARQGRATIATRRAGLLELPDVADTLRLWQSSCAASFRLTEIIWAATGAMHGGAPGPCAGRDRAGHGGRPAPSPPPAGRRGPSWPGAISTTAWTTASPARVASLDLVAQPAREILDLLAQPVAGDAPAEPGPTDRAA